jgi:hypothetical protein
LLKASAMNTPEIKQFIKEHSTLFWYTPDGKKEDISNELLVETTLNYGNMDDIRQLIRIMGMEQISGIFLGLDGRKKLNYYPEIRNFFSLLFNKYA